MAKRPVKGGLPSRQQILDFIASSDDPAGKREIARAFGLKGNEKIALKTLLRDMADEGLIDSAPGRAFHKMGGVPKVTVLRVADVDDSGRAWAVPERWEAEGAPPRLRVMERRGRDSALGVGDRILARTEEGREGLIAHPMKKLLKGSELVLGVVHQEGTSFWLKPVEKKERRELPISDLGEAQPGDLVLAEKTGRPPRLTARVDTILGDPFAPRSFSLIAIHKHGIPHLFPQSVTEEAERVAGQPLGEREDLTHIPIVAIDPADARDHDDAVWAAPDEDPANQGGWKAIVAIADVSFYVRPGSDLDKEARKRGNSVYFPDRVVPMLPETLSADICSLKEGEDRAALACHLQVTKAGTLKSWRFTRARVRIAANIAYEDAQALIDGDERIEVASSPCAMPEIPSALLEFDAEAALGVLARALRGAGEAGAARARSARTPGDARREGADPLGRPARAIGRAQAHRGLHDRGQRRRGQGAGSEKGAGHVPRPRAACPREAGRAQGLSEDLRSRVRAGAGGEAGDVQPPDRSRPLDRAPRRKPGSRETEETGPGLRRGTEEDEPAILPQIMEQVLRTQTQAYYGPQNHGHFGLALGSYAHFTSPIRRYADLVVHRALVRSHKLGEGGLTDDEAAAMEVTGELISNLERRAMVAERETMDRYVAAYLSEHVGELVQCRITGVQPFGFFATVEELGGDGLVPVSTLGQDYFRYDEASQTLVGDESGVRFAPGQRLTLRLAEANPVSGGLRFELSDSPRGAGRTPKPREERPGRGAQGRRGRLANIRHQGRRK